MIESWRRTFASICGEAHAFLDAGDERLAPHPSPRLVVAPASAAELAACVRAAFADGIGLVPAGGNTHPRLAAPGAPPCAIIDTRCLDRVIEHAADDLTFTAGAGLTLARAQAAVAPARQQLPFTSPQASRSTLGGLVARAQDGPRRKSFGFLRDQILGIAVVHGDGRATKAGGRVVKNVTGFDLARLYCGARGALGIITEITFRLRALSPASAMVRWECARLADAWKLAWELRRRVPDLFSIHVVQRPEDRGPPPARPWTVVAAMRGEPELVAALTEACRAHPGAERAGDPEAAALDVFLVDPVPEGLAQLRIQALPADVGRLVDLVVRLEPRSASIDVETGAIDLGLASWSGDAAQERALEDALRPLGALADLPRDPLFHLRRFERFPSQRPDAPAVAASLKRELDPKGLLNPGRTESTT